MSSAWDGLRNNKAITELPHYAVNKKLPEDTFFTDKSVAERCVKTFKSVCEEQGISMVGYTFIEPSAGEGCFYDLLPSKKLGLDIRPMDDRIERANFLTWHPKREGKYAVIGNPPFGVRGAVALAFVNRALLFADVVAFILPMSFYSNGKGSNMKRVKGASLIHNEKLPAKSFYIPSTRLDVSVNTIFQIWRKGGKTSVFADYDVSKYAYIYTCCSSPDRYCGLGRGRDYDCFIASTFYKTGIRVVKKFEDVMYGSGYGMIIKRKKREIMKLLRGADWLQYCSDATNHCKHIRMYHIRKFLGDNGYGVAK